MYVYPNDRSSFANCVVVPKSSCEEIVLPVYLYSIRFSIKGILGIHCLVVVVKIRPWKYLMALHDSYSGGLSLKK